MNNSFLYGGDDSEESIIYYGFDSNDGMPLYVCRACCCFMSIDDLDSKKGKETMSTLFTEQLKKGK